MPTHENAIAPETTEPAFVTFDALQKGDPAPSWIFDAAVAGWGFPSDRLTVTLITVSENATFRLEVDGAPTAVMRVHRPGYVADPRQIEAELSWLEALELEFDTPVPTPRRTLDGGLVFAPHSPDDTEWFCVVFAFIDGEILEDVADPTPYYERIGRITASLHLQSRSWRRPEGFRRFSWQLDDMVGPNARWGDWRGAELASDQRSVLEQAEAAALARLDGWERTPETWGIIHADLRPSNVMTRDGDLTIIDFDDCGSTYFLYDFASAFSFIEHERSTPDLAKRWVRGYTSILPLNDDDLVHACSLSMIRRVQMLGWTTTHREDALPPEIWNAQVPGTEDVARKYLDDPLWLLH